MTNVSLARLEHLRLEHRALLGHGHLFSFWLVAEIHTDGSEMLLKRTHAGGGDVRVNPKNLHVRSRHALENILQRLEQASSSVTL